MKAVKWQNKLSVNLDFLFVTGTSGSDWPTERHGDPHILPPGPPRWEVMITSPVLTQNTIQGARSPLQSGETVK